jgi:hypothetical protein
MLATVHDVMEVTVDSLLALEADFFTVLMVILDQ